MINNRYNLIKKLGEGRSAVYLCKDMDNYNNLLAIKILPADASNDEKALFKEEFLTIRRFNYPNIVKVNEFGMVLDYKPVREEYGISEGSYFITEEYIEGKTVTEYYKEDNEEILDELVTQICYTLYFLHISNYIYYDLKAENILVGEIEGKPVVKFIDFGLVQNARKLNPEIKHGTAEYIAPEILSGKKVSYKIDFYSLGVLIYRLIYKYFPFESTTGIDVLRSHINSEISLAETTYSERWQTVLQNLLSKDPSERFDNAFQILNALGKEINDETIRRFILPKVFVLNSSVVSIQKYIDSKDKDGIELITGLEGAGKTSIIEEIGYNFEGIIIIEHDTTAGASSLWKTILKRILYSEHINKYLGNFLITRINKIIINAPDNLIEELKSIFTNLTTRVKFTIVFDDFNLYDPYTLQILKEIMPILIVNNINVIITECIEEESKADFISNKHIRKLTAFDEEQVKSFLSKTFSDAVPQERLTKIVIENSDLFPGSITKFLQDIIFLGIINFSPDGVKISESSDLLDMVRNRHNEIHAIRINSLLEEEYTAAKILSVFNVNITSKMLSLLYKEQSEEVVKHIEELKAKGILKQNNNPELEFTSSGLKSYIYNSVEDKVALHKKVSDVISGSGSDIKIDKTELARQYELAEQYDKCYAVNLRIFEEAEKLSAYSYQKSILEHLMSVPGIKKQYWNLGFLFIKVLHNMGDYSVCIREIDKFDYVDRPLKVKQDVLSIKADCKIAIGEIDDGIELYHTLLQMNVSPAFNLDILYEVASAEYFLNKLEAAEERCLRILADQEASEITIAKTYNLLGIVKSHQSAGLEKSIEYFNQSIVHYNKLNMKSREAVAEMNLGIVFYLLGELSKAELHWKKSLNVNLEIGNLEQEASLLMNYGIYYYDRIEYEKAADNYKRALQIFMSLGIKNSVGKVYYNLSEVFFMSCEYDEAINNLNEAKNVFESTDDFFEMAEALLLEAKIYLVLNNLDMLSRVIKASGGLPGDKGDVRTKLYYELMLFMKQYLADRDTDELYKKGESLIASFSEIKDRNNYLFCTNLMIYKLIDKKEFQRALTLINSESLINNISEIIYAKAERLYQLGIIAYETKNSDLLNSVEYFEDAYNLIKEGSISELTWQVLYSLSEAYSDRGSFNKVKDFIIISKSLLDHISSGIKDFKVRSLYLSEKGRQNAYRKLEVWEKLIK